MIKEEIQLKKGLHESCNAMIDTQIAQLQLNLSSIEEARNNETKSSVGDKYETGRAMMQMEEEQINARILQAVRNKNQLLQINPSQLSKSATIGSIVFTKNAKYFISVGLGKIKLKGDSYYCISIDSPIGQKLKFKEQGATIRFNNQTIMIEKVF